jgi:CheY-like chemotaxis protein
LLIAKKNLLSLVQTLAYFWLYIGAKNILPMRKIVIHSLRAEFRAMIRGLLTNVEAFFVPSSSREELFRICQTSKCDLVLTDDVRMFMNGSDAVARIRQGGPLPLIFVLSDDLSEESVTALLEEGVNQFISLPVAPERLRSKVSTQQKEFV